MDNEKRWLAEQWSRVTIEDNLYFIYWVHTYEGKPIQVDVYQEINGKFQWITPSYFTSEQTEQLKAVIETPVLLTEEERERVIRFKQETKEELTDVWASQLVVPSFIGESQGLFYLYVQSHEREWKVYGLQPHTLDWLTSIMTYPVEKEVNVAKLWLQSAPWVRGLSFICVNDFRYMGIRLETIGKQSVAFITLFQYNQMEWQPLRAYFFVKEKGDWRMGDAKDPILWKKHGFLWEQEVELAMEHQLYGIEQLSGHRSKVAEA